MLNQSFSDTNMILKDLKEKDKEKEFNMNSEDITQKRNKSDLDRQSKNWE
jgi:hypothetical protein